MQAKGIAHFGLILSLSLFTNPGHAVTVSDLLISEVMANPTALSDARGEWFELYNPTTEAINLREITIGDIGTPGAAGSANIAPSAVPIPAAAWLFVSGLLALFSLTSARSSPSQTTSSPRRFMSSRYVNPACAGGPRKRGSHNPLSQPATAPATRDC